jgi:hypothetical protein
MRRFIAAASGFRPTAGQKLQQALQLQARALVTGRPVYGLGGCAALARDLDRTICSPWRELCRRVTGSPDTPLHASDFAEFAARENIEAVAEFFRVQPFARFGAIIATDSTDRRRRPGS